MAARKAQKPEEGKVWRRVTAWAELRDFGCPRKLIDLCENGTIKSQRIGKFHFVHKDEVERMTSPVSATR